MATKRRGSRGGRSGGAGKTYVVYYIDIKDSSAKGKGEGIKFAWRAPSDTYPDDVAKELGVNKAKDEDGGLIFGMNSPRPVKLRINYSSKQGSSSSALLFCDPSQLSHVLVGNSLRGKAFRGAKITSVSTPKSSTNPNRSKGSEGSSNPATKRAGARKPAARNPAARASTGARRRRTA